MQRLGLWGVSTAFADFKAFKDMLGAGGTPSESRTRNLLLPRRLLIRRL
jgi:hypothetical protein